MKLFPIFSISGFSNTYLLGPDEGSDAIIIDPGSIEPSLIQLIENNHYYIRTTLLTHSHPSHINGLRALQKIYDTEVIAFYNAELPIPFTKIQKQRQLVLSGMELSIIPIGIHSIDSIVFKIANILFTGDILLAGQIGDTQNFYARALLVNAIRKKLLSLDENLLVMPGHGPPTTLKIEKKTNHWLNEFL